MRQVVLLAALAAALPPAAARSAPLPARLTGWEGPAHLAINPGPGPTDFELVAEVAWDHTAPADPGRYALRLVLPDGQVSSRPLLPGDRPGRGRVSFLASADAIRDRRPEAVALRAGLVDAATGAAVSNILTADIGQFPSPRVAGESIDAGPFGWGRPLAGQPGAARPLPRPGPDGLRFVRIPATAAGPAVYLAATEASVAQVKSRLKGYDPRVGRSDEFALEGDDQPAVGLDPDRTETYLKSLTQADPSGLAYRLPTRDEWLRAARAGRSTPFWWGAAPSFPAGANFLGPEPALAADSTAPALPAGPGPGYRANPWGLFHTFGNVTEWATGPAGGFVRLGGHFRTEPASPLEVVKVADRNATGPDPYVGVRPAFSLDAGAATALVRRRLMGIPGSEAIRVAFDPDRATVTLSGAVADPAARRRADIRLGGLWFLAAVENRLDSPGIAAGQLARLAPAPGKPRRIAPLGRVQDGIPIAVRWAIPLPVEGSAWYVNIYRAGGHSAHTLIERVPGRPVILALVDPRAGGAASVALSLGAPAPTPDDPRVVSNVLPLATPAP